MHPSELVRLADLIRLSAETARLFSDTETQGNGRISRITELARQIELCANELREIGEAMVTANDER